MSFPIVKRARTFLPEIIAPGTGLTPPSDRSILPTNNVHTIQDVLDGKKYQLPGGGGNWSEGEDSAPKSYKEDGDSYKKDVEILRRLTEQDFNESFEKWKVRTRGGTKTFPSFELANQYRSKLMKQRIPVSWIARVAQKNNREILISDAMSSTVMVETISYKDGIKESGSAFSIGSGIYMTCAHVIASYKDRTVDYLNNNLIMNIIHNGEKFGFKIKSIDAENDVAILISEKKIRGFEFDVEVKIGDPVFSVGSPHGYENNISFGEVGALDRKIYNEKDSILYMFVNVSVFPGNSGGPIVNALDGKVVGMVSAIISPSGEYGLNMAIPSKYLVNYL
jgi:S1-C subfamily serine protease